MCWAFWLTPINPDRISKRSPAFGQSRCSRRYSTTAPPTSAERSTGPPTTRRSPGTPSDRRPMKISGRMRPNTSHSAALNAPAARRARFRRSASARLATLRTGESDRERGAARSGMAIDSPWARAAVRSDHGNARPSRLVTWPMTVWNVAAISPVWEWISICRTRASCSPSDTSPAIMCSAAPGRASRRNRICCSLTNTVASAPVRKTPSSPMAAASPTRPSTARAT